MERCMLGTAKRQTHKKSNSPNPKSPEREKSHLRKPEGCEETQKKHLGCLDKLEDVSNM